ncbi:hypothetical protein LIER_29479 [Lithospermum erythrorhizon]|uniref:GAG-pre-integrase domain-containing protein n=1 Tax=Lithospermum erythrorhizon TaxID=34254 RepID=A0AAV3RKV5_LITER
MGHFEDTCYSKHGFPDKGGARLGRVQPCDGPAVGGRPSTGCGLGAMQAAPAPVVHAVVGEARSQPSSADSGRSGPLGRLFDTQWHNLLQLIGNSDSPPVDRLNGTFFCLPLDYRYGCLYHVTGFFDGLSNVGSMLECGVELPDGTRAPSTKFGSVYLSHELKLRNVLYVPQFNCNLMFVSQLIGDIDCVVQFAKNVCVIQDCRSRTLIGVGECRDGLYYFRNLPGLQALHVIQSASLELWHRRLGHPSAKIVQSLSFISRSSNFLNKACTTCHQAKHTRESFPLSTHKSSRPFELIHCDVWGPYRTVSSCGACYFLTIFDDYSRVVWIFLLLDKKEVFRYFLQFLAIIDRQFNSKFLGRVYINVAYLINRTPSSVLKTPYELLYGCPPTYSELRVFGSLCYAHDQKCRLDKFSSRSGKCVFVGYPYGKKGWRLYDLSSHEFFISRDVVFYENEFPYFSSATIVVPSIVTPAVSENVSEFGSDDGEMLDGPGLDGGVSDRVVAKLPDQSAVSVASGSGVPELVPAAPVSAGDSLVGSPAIGSSGDGFLGRGMRTKTPSTRLRDFVTSRVKIVSPSPVRPGEINVLVYVDSVILSLNNSAALLSFKEYELLGIEVAGSPKGIFLSQRKYTLYIIFDTGLLGAKPISFSLEQNHHLTRSESPLFGDVERYRRLVGRLLYLSFTRPDFRGSFVVPIHSCSSD